jgi:hypothetical protein
VAIGAERELGEIGLALRLYAHPVFQPFRQDDHARPLGQRPGIFGAVAKNLRHLQAFFDVAHLRNNAWRRRAFGDADQKMTGILEGDLSNTAVGACGKFAKRTAADLPHVTAPPLDKFGAPEIVLRFLL